MLVMSVDIETYSEIDIRKTGLYKYVECPKFEILLFACAINNGPVRIFDLTKGPLPVEIINGLKIKRQNFFN